MVVHGAASLPLLSLSKPTPGTNSYMGGNSPKHLDLDGTTKPGVGVGSGTSSAPFQPLLFPAHPGLLGNRDAPSAVPVTHPQIRGTNRTRAARKSHGISAVGSLLLPKQLPLYHHLQRMGMNLSFPWCPMNPWSLGDGFIPVQSFPPSRLRRPVKESTALSAIFYIKYIYLYIKIESCLFQSVRKQLDKNWVRKQVDKNF